jgi:3-phenylpropionate/cinnamic acid dioxygenase small subunit
VPDRAQNALLSQGEAEAFLYGEAELLDDMRLEEWLKLFTQDGLYWIPLDDKAPIEQCASIVRDDPLRREERVHHLLHTRFPSQSPPSRTLHAITNVRLSGVGGGEVVLRSNQTIHEVRTGDYRQTGLGQLTMVVAKVEHTLRLDRGCPRIACKKIMLLNRDMPLGNLTFLI